MYYIRKALLLLTIMCGGAVLAQECNCPDNLEWMISTFEQNDAGFQYVINQKGKDEYREHNRVFRQKAGLASSTEDCADLLNKWLGFFRNAHIGVELVATSEKANTGKKASDEEIRARYADSERYEMSATHFLDHLAGLTGHPGMQGIWMHEGYEMAVIKAKEGAEEAYIGFILNADGVYWSKNQVKLKIYDEGNRHYSGTYYMQDHTPRKMKSVKAMGDNYLLVGNYIWERTEPRIIGREEAKTYVEMMKSDKPVFKTISPTTTLLRVPSFQHDQKKYIDSILKVHHGRICTHQNFIIDIRNGTGGSDASYEELLKYLYTNPIRTIGVEYLSTPLNNKRYDELLADSTLSEKERKEITELQRKLNKNLWEFVNPSGAPFSIYHQDTVYRWPENVAILINEGNGSTDEQFLLAARQSTKVKLFGHSTKGVLDISNMASATFPCHRLVLHYATSKSLRIPMMTIDDKGIQPDYFIHSIVPEYKWPSYVEDIFNFRLP